TRRHRRACQSEQQHTTRRHSQRPEPSRASHWSPLARERNWHHHLDEGAADITATDLARPNGPPPHHALAALEDRSMSEESNKQCSMELTDTALEARLFPDVGAKQGHRRQGEPDWASIPNPVGGESEINHLVMAITSAEATFWHYRFRQ